MSIDRAIQFTQDYLEIIEKRFRYRWDDRGNPVFTPSDINIFSLEIARNDLHELLSGVSSDNARSDSRSFGQQHIQTVGFGLVQDFDRFIKAGFLCGKRVVLWDFLGSRGLADLDDSMRTKLALGSIASNLMLLKPIIAQGGIVVLPHPKDWSEKALLSLRELSASPVRSSTDYGLVSTLSVLEEIPMHPYTLFPDHSINWPGHPDGLWNNEYFSKDHYAFHKVVNNLFEDHRFAFLSDVKAEHFFDLVNKENSFYEELHKILTPPPSMKSPVEIDQYSKRIIASIAELLEKRNSRIASSAANKWGGTLALMGAVGTLLNTTTISNPAQLGISAAVVGLSAAAFRFLSNYLKKENESVVVQAFYEISQAQFYEEPDEDE